MHTTLILLSIQATPHVCRHTFCSNMAKSGMNPKTLQYIMNAANRIIEHPDWYDSIVDFYGTEMYARNIYQMGSDLKYTAEAVISE